MEEEFVIESGTNVATNSFTEDIARYFKIYLETNLRGTLVPARSVSGRRINGLRSQLYLDRYPQLNKNLYKNVTSGLSQEAFVITQNKYVTHTDERLSDQLSRAIEALDSATVESFVRQAVLAADDSLVRAPEDRDKFMHLALESVHGLIASDLIVPMLRGVPSTVSSKNALPERTIREDAAEAVYGALAPSFEVILDKHFSGRETPEQLQKAFASALSFKVVQTVMREFLEELNTADAYQNVYKLHLANNSLATTELYMYFCEVHIGEYTFPLFYTPIKTTHAYPSVTCGFENRMLVNTKALDFILAEYNRLIGYNEEFTGAIESVLTIDPRNRKAMLPQLQRIVDIVSDTFGLEQGLKLDSATEQRATNMGVTLNNRLQFAIFDSSHESVVADYEELLDGGNKSSEAFRKLVQSFVTEEPARYVQEIAEEWNEKPIADKLTSMNPLSLNNEQKQAMIALNKPDCTVTVVNGASGTGKSHFASGVVTQSFIDGFTTLILTDTRAARDDVAGSALDVLADARAGTAFHHPILRLDDANEDFLEEIEAQFLEKLQKFHQTYTSLQSELRTAKTRKLKDTAETLATMIQNAENVNLHEVEQTVNNESKFGGREWIIDEPIDEINDELPKLHQAVQYIRASDANYLLPYIEASQQKAIAEFISIIREYERVSKNVNTRLPEFIVRYRKLLPDQKNKLQSALSYIHSNYRQYTKILAKDPITERLEISDNTDYRALASKQVLLNRLVDLGKDARRYMGHDKARNALMLDELLSYSAEPEDAAAAITNYIEQVISLKSKIFGFSGRTLVVENLTRQLRKSVPEFSVKDPEKHLDELQQMVDLVEFIIEQLAQLGLDLGYWKEVLYILKTDNTHVKELQKLISSLVAPADFEFMADHRIYEADNLLANISLLQHATELNDVFQGNPNLSTLFGIKSIGQVLAQPHAYSGRFNKLATDLDDVKQLDDHKRIIKQFIKKYPAASKRVGISYGNGTLDVIDDTFANSTPDEIKEYLAFKKKEQDITSYFREMISDNFTRTVQDLQQISALQTTHSHDEKLMKYVEAHAENFNAIKTALRNKQRLSPTLFKSLQQVFPCVVADVREYAQFIPLEKDLFDVVVVDEASRIGVAESLPALLRGKKIVVLGDDKQHSNPRISQVNESLNTMFRGRIAASLFGSLKDVTADAKNVYVKRVRQNFDVTNSVLDFCRPIANAELTFSNYFRSPPELVSFANKHFYSDKLRCLKARALPLNESIKVEQVDKDSVLEGSLHTNQAEVRHIINALTDMKEMGFEGTIGIITPYHEQAVLMQKELDECVINDWFEKCKLKVMTFDTAQAESRDYMFYSLVSNDEFDRHDYFFPSSMKTAGGHAARRLSVGFSRAGSVMHFVTSKPISSFGGAMGEALKYMHNIVTTGDKKSGTTTDILQAAESLLPQYFYATNFYKKHTEKTRLVTQFSLGDLLKALSPSYRHPSYKVDFLVALGEERIIVTYDEFKEKFLAGEAKNVAANYLTADDIYNQKLLEGYGYKFLRLNKFNLGARPIEMLDKLLSEAIKKHSWPRDNGFIKD